MEVAVDITRKVPELVRGSGVHGDQLMMVEVIRQSKRGDGEGRGGGGGEVVRLPNDQHLTCLHCVLPDSWVNLCFVVDRSSNCMSNVYGERIVSPDLWGSEEEEIGNIGVSVESAVPVSVGSLFPLRHWGPPPPRYRGKSRRLRRRCEVKRRTWLWGAKLIRKLNEWFAPDGAQPQGRHSRRRRGSVPSRKPQLFIFI